MAYLYKKILNVCSGVWRWLSDCVLHHKIRMAAGLIVLAAELFLFLGTGVMLEDKTNYLTGDGSWEEQQSDGASSFCQAFIPESSHLHLISFLMGKDGVTRQDGQVGIVIADGENEVLFDETRSFAEISDGFFTDVEVDLKLSKNKVYYLTLVSAPSSLGEYPTVGVCGKEQYLPENQTLTRGDELPGVQLVARYQYQDVMSAGKLRNVIFICIVTALGIIFGLPDNIILRKAVGLVLMIAVPYVVGQRLELLTYKEMFYLPFAMKWNIGIMYALEVVVLLCTHSARVTIIMTNLLLTLLYSANYFVLQYRGTSLRMNDFSAAGTAARMAGSYNFAPNAHLAMAWGLLFLFMVWGFWTEGGRSRRKPAESDRKSKIIKKVLSYCITIALAAGIVLYGGYQLLFTDFLDVVGFADKELRGYSYELIYSFDGYLVATCIEIKNSRITPPSGYSVQRVEEQLAKNNIEQVVEEGTDLPHVIVVMNESFADLRVVGELELSCENMEFFNSLEENTVRGYVNASVLGGGTANSEFEMFTGCTMAFLPRGYYPYQQALRKPVDSLVSRLQAYGYTTYSMHPEPAANWNRAQVYKYYGFDECLWKEDFNGAEKIHRGVSDEETYLKIIQLYENRSQDEKMFIFDLTVQNHGDYPGQEETYEVRDNVIKDSRLDEYLTLVKISDEAFADLVHYFEGQDEKVIICMFGDHQPWVSSLIMGTDNDNMAEKMKKYKTPFVIWANYDVEEAEGYDISLNYLGGLLLRTAGIPLSPYFAFLEEQREEYPIITINGYVDKDGNYKNWGSAGDEFPEYRMLQYNYLFDKHSVEWGY